ncbi:2-hydroxyacid dehydrogenase [Nitrincola iocasae]|uniref:2-hydroxyacid dehydrogenase n=1 Tax=Nitrincola iocasae TaxID=2614693 RepID=A0A5J6LFP8_9GAMM|nr:2-hydroxyacid dehydrogenase [Nitrincola iocasae]QEW07176.1 2-hydroxyacid dehydrogenase [Nitrincola iocasae]
MRAVFLDSLSLDDLDLTPLEAELSELVVYPGSLPEQVAERIQGFDIVITNKALLPAEVIQASAALKLICVVATGVNNVDIEAANAAGIPVYNCQGYGTGSVAQHVLMLMLVMHTRFVDYKAAVEQGRWNQSSQFCLLDYPILELRGRTLGIIGYGELGAEVKRLAEAFGMKVLIAARPGTQATPGRLPLAELLPQIDVLSLHCPLTEATRDLIDADALALMPSGSYLVNAARGGIVNETALADALRSGHLAGAATDVLTAEPPQNGNLLLDAEIPNLLVTPHCAWGSRQARETIIRQTCGNIQAWLQGSNQRRVN